MLPLRRAGSKNSDPDAKLHWIVTPSMVELLDGNPYVDEIIPWERDEYEAHSKKLHIPTMWRMWWELKAKLEPYNLMWLLMCKVD